MGRETIKDVLERNIALLKSDNRIDKIKASKTIQYELAMIKGFDTKMPSLLRGYAEWMVKRHQTVLVVGIIQRVKDLWIAFRMKHYIKILINQCEVQNYGDGDNYIKEILKILRKELY